ncbi:unnamed protein product [Caretta caretta]
MVPLAASAGVRIRHPLPDAYGEQLDLSPHPGQPWCRPQPPAQVRPVEQTNSKRRGWRQHHRKATREIEVSAPPPPLARGLARGRRRRRRRRRRQQQQRPGRRKGESEPAAPAPPSLGCVQEEPAVIVALKKGSDLDPSSYFPGAAVGPSREARKRLSLRSFRQ